MPQSVVPMIHVPDVRDTVEWYKTIGFKVLRTNEVDGVMDWAKLTFEDSAVMFGAGGKAGREHRREVDLYITCNGIDALFARLCRREPLEIVEQPYDTFYGMREFTIKDCNGFWITFGQPSGT